MLEIPQALGTSNIYLFYSNNSKDIIGTSER